MFIMALVSASGSQSRDVDGAGRVQGSRPSLIASSAIGGLLLLATWQMGPYPQAGVGIAMGAQEMRTILFYWDSNLDQAIRQIPAGMHTGSMYYLNNNDRS